MAVLLTGSDGFIGSNFKVLNNRPKLITVGSKNKVNSDFNVDLTDSLDWFVKELGVEVVVHTATTAHKKIISQEDKNKVKCLDVEATTNLANKAASLDVKRFIFLSTVNVGLLSQGSESSSTDFIAYQKYLAEESLMKISTKTEMEVVIIRPALVYGPGVKANFASLLNLVAKSVPLPFGCINDNKRSLVSVTNLVDLIDTCITHPKAVGEIFVVSDDYDVSTSEMVSLMAKSLSAPKWQLPVPQWFYRLVGKMTGKMDVVERLVGSLQVDISHTKETLGWMPPQNINQGFQETAQSFLQSKNNS